MKLLYFLIISVLPLVSASSSKLRIVGGADAKAGEYPFVAAIYTRTNTSTYFCGGALLNTQWVVTAAQCVYGAISFTIHLGSNSLSGSDPNRVTLSSSESEYFPIYNPDTLEHDVGLIKLRMPIELTDYVQPVPQLPGYEIDVDSNCIAVGWGQTSDVDSGLSQTLKEVNLRALNNAECKLYYGPQVTYDMICMSGNYNEGTCIGDTGSPLLQMKDGEYMHVGIASFLSGNGCESTDPSGFTRTIHYIHWIRSIIGPV